MTDPWPSRPASFEEVPASMKSLIPLLAGMVLAVACWFLWSAFQSDPGRGRAPGGTDGDQGAFALDERIAMEREAERAAPGMPQWMIGTTIETKASGGRRDGLPDSLGRVEMLTRGRTVAGANTVTLKLALAELREDIKAMTGPAAENLARYFADSQDPTLKYFMLILFGEVAGEPFVDVVADYYEADPNTVGQALGYMVMRSPKAAEAFAKLIENEYDPMRRAQLISRAGFTGSPAVEELMSDLFEHSGRSAARRLALWGLARGRSEAGQGKLLSLLDGPEERAVYVVGENRESEPELEDLRCHAVLALLMNGSRDIRADLLRRARDQGGDVGHYVDRYFAAVDDPSFVPDVVTLMKDRGEIGDRYLLYLGRQAKSEHRPLLESLLEVAPDEETRARIQAVIDRVN